MGYKNQDLVQFPVKGPGMVEPDPEPYFSLKTAPAPY